MKVAALNGAERSELLRELRGFVLGVSLHLPSVLDLSVFEWVQEVVCRVLVFSIGVCIWFA